MEAIEVLEKMLAQLTAWKQLPKYQMERRADLFFGFYLKDILRQARSRNSGETYFEEGEQLWAVPEFPISTGEGNLRSTNADYFVTNGKKFYLIELKTDAASIQNEQSQLAYYARLEKGNAKTWERLREHIENVCRSYERRGRKDYRIKYNNLYRMIAPFRNLYFAGVVYITPELKKDIGFETILFSDIQRMKIDDPVFALFQKALTEWNKPAYELPCTLPSTEASAR